MKQYLAVETFFDDDGRPIGKFRHIFCAEHWFQAEYRVYCQNDDCAVWWENDDGIEVFELCGELT